MSKIDGKIFVLRDDPDTRIAELEMQNATLQKLLEKKEKAIENLIRENASLQKKALYDPLTGACNRWKLTEEIEQYDDLARRSDDVICAVYLIDLDYFKLINVIFGHIVGDIAIRSAAHAIMRVKRKYDILFRYGGDEFVLLTLLKNKLTPESAKQHATEIMHRIEHAISQVSLDGYDDAISISASVGFHIIDKNKELNPTTLLKLADRALYERKQKKESHLTKLSVAFFISFFICKI